MSSILSSSEFFFKILTMCVEVVVSILSKASPGGYRDGDRYKALYDIG